MDIDSLTGENAGKTGLGGVPYREFPPIGSTGPLDGDARRIPPPDFPHLYKLIGVDHQIQRMCAQMHLNGVTLDQLERLRLERQYRTLRNKHLSKVLDFAHKIRPVWKTTGKVKIREFGFNPGSLPMMRRLLYEDLFLIPSVFTDTGEPSTSDEALRAFIFDPTVSDEVKDFLISLRRLRAAEKVINAYLLPIGNYTDNPERKGWIRPGTMRCHADWKGHTVVSGRLSCSPGLQTIPRVLASMIVPGPGNKLVYADADQLELRFAVGVGGDPKYTEALRDNLDPHAISLLLAMGDEMLEVDGAPPPGAGLVKKWKAGPHGPNGEFVEAGGISGTFDALRDLVKGLVYASLYAAQPETVYNILSKAEDAEGNLTNEDLTLTEVKAIHRKWLDNAPSLEENWEAFSAFVRQNGYIQSAIFGRRRYLLNDKENINDIANFPAQCIPGEVRVLTKKGYLPIGTLVGQTVEAWTGSDWAPARVIPKGTAEIWKTTMESGDVFWSDGTHCLQAEEEWIPVSKLQPGAAIARNLPRPLAYGEVVWDDAEAIGAQVAKNAKFAQIPEIAWRSDWRSRWAFIRGFLKEIGENDEFDLDGTTTLISGVFLDQMPLVEGFSLLCQSVGLQTNISTWDQESTEEEGPREARWYVLVNSMDPEAYLPGNCWELVEKVENLGVEAPVYTLMVDHPTHQYVAQEFISRNSTGADYMADVALEMMSKYPQGFAGPGTGVVMQIHDALVFEVPEELAEQCAADMNKAFERTYSCLPGVTLKGEAKIKDRLEPQDFPQKLGGELIGLDELEESEVYNDLIAGKFHHGIPQQDLVNWVEGDMAAFEKLLSKMKADGKAPEEATVESMGWIGSDSVAPILDLSPGAPEEADGQQELPADLALDLLAPMADDVDDLLDGLM